MKVRNIDSNIEFIIYLDTKIKGALLQTIKYFHQGIFGKNTLIIFKEYISIKSYFRKLLKENSIAYISYKKYKEIPNLKGKIVFYLFNAQSNCRIVANRSAKHIFVTHGESNKVSSVKPIIKIYDHVIVSGDLGVDRYLKSKLFYQDDISRHRIIKMGNTFIGEAFYKFDENSNAILYAPTWEGGIVEENYSSINKDINSFIILGQYANENSLKEIYIQPHPNTGHRDKRFYIYLVKGINYLLAQGYKVKIIDFKMFFFIKLKLKKDQNLLFVKSYSNIFGINKAFVDVSAMEVQLIDKNIPTYVFFTETPNSMPENSLLHQHYSECGIYSNIYKPYKSIDRRVKEYCISYENGDFEHSMLSARIDVLKKFLSVKV